MPTAQFKGDRNLTINSAEVNHLYQHTTEKGTGAIRAERKMLFIDQRAKLTLWVATVPGESFFIFCEVATSTVLPTSLFQGSVLPFAIFARWKK